MRDTDGRATKEMREMREMRGIREGTARHIVMVAALAALLFILAGCDMPVLGGQSGATSQAAPQAPLAWHTVSMPTGFSLKETTIAISPANGHDAWVCMWASVGTFTIWATKDAGTSWQSVSTLSPVTPKPAYICNIVASQTDPQSVAAVVSWGASGDGLLRSTSFVSSDGGVHWKHLRGNIAIRELGNSGGTLFASVLNTEIAGGTGDLATLMTEGDTLTWHSIAPTDMDDQDDIVSFSTHDPGGVLFAATSHRTFWRSTDGGAHWTRIRLSVGDVWLATWLPTQERWGFCATNSVSIIQVSCSVDSGATWSHVPTIEYSMRCDDCASGQQPVPTKQICEPFAIRPDASLLAVCPKNGSTFTDKAFTVYHLAHGKTAWNAIGSAPAQFIVATATGQLWASDGDTNTISVATYSPA